MTFCEIWLEMRSTDSAIRVALLVPIGLDAPVEFTKREMREGVPQKEFYVSQWFGGIVAAKDLMDFTAQYYAERKIHFLFFREIRPTTQTVAN